MGTTATSPLPLLPPSLRESWMWQAEALTELAISRTALFYKRRQGIFECKRYKGKVLVKKSDVKRVLDNLPSA